MTAQPPFRSLRTFAGLIAVAGLLLLVASAIAYTLNRSWAFESQLGAGTGSVLLLGAVLLRPDAVHMAITGRSVKYGSHAVLLSLAFIGILGFINFIILKNDQEYDLTETGRFTLSEQTVQILRDIDEPIQVFGFFKAGDPRIKLATDYLERYRHYTKYLAYEFHDPNIEPALAQSLQLSNYGLVFVSGDKQHIASNVDEQTLTSSLIRVTDDQKRVVYFITGHGQHGIDDGGEQGYSAAKQTLEQENYVVNSLNLTSVGEVPADATILVLAGNNFELSELEVQLIEDWMGVGGKLMLLVDPLEPVPLSQLLQEYSLTLEDNYVVEDYDHSLVILGPEGFTPQLIAPIVVKYPYHEVTRGLDGYQSFFPFARSITVAPAQDMTHSVLPLLTTSHGSWAETDLEASEPEYTDGVDALGPMHLAVVAENHENKARLVVFGDAGFVTNQNLSPQMANLDLFMNAVNWLAEEEALISIRPKQPENRNLIISSMQLNMILFTSVIFIPLVVFGVGVSVWWKRR